MSATPFYYRLTMSLLKPLYQFKLSTGKTLPNEVDERFGKQYPAINTQKSIIWCHAVSLGETNTAEPILRGLLAEGYTLWLTSTTHTGYDRIEELFAEEIFKGDVYHSFVPVDDGKVIDKFLDHVQPIGAIFIETELWATTLAELHERQIASILVNGRLSEKSFNGYRKAEKVSRSMMENLSLIIAQDADSAKRFRILGATSDKIRIASSLKWSSKANPIMVNRANSLSKEWQLENRSVILAASTHEGEEKEILQSFAKIQKIFSNKNPLLIIVPRHPERFDDIAQLIESQNYPVIRRSQNQAPTLKDSVYLADSMGELGVWYALADIAFVGGSLVNIGGHNPIEPAIVGKPIVMGQYTQSCEQIVEKLKEVGALVQVNDLETLTKIFGYWLHYPEKAQKAGAVGQILAEQYQDATGQQLSMIKDALSENEELRVQTEVRLIDNEIPLPNDKVLIDDFAD